MNLSKLIERYETIQSRLITEIQNDASENLIRKLDSISTETCSVIAQIHLTNPIDINRQIKFFMNRSRAIEDQILCETDYRTINNLIDRYTNRASVNPSYEKVGSVSIGAVPDSYLNDSGKLKSFVEKSESRVSIFNLDYCFEMTSRGNANFHSSAQSDFVGTPLVNLIGETRFLTRARAYFDRTFSGKSQKYCYFLETAEQGERLMSCELSPYRNSDGSVKGALFNISDVTDQILNLTLVEKQPTLLTSQYH